MRLILGTMHDADSVPHISVSYIFRDLINAMLPRSRLRNDINRAGCSTTMRDEMISNDTE